MRWGAVGWGWGGLGCDIDPHADLKWSDKCSKEECYCRGEVPVLREDASGLEEMRVHHLQAVLEAYNVPLELLRLHNSSAATGQ